MAEKSGQETTNEASVSEARVADHQITAGSGQPPPRRSRFADSQREMDGVAAERGCDGDAPQNISDGLEDDHDQVVASAAEESDHVSTGDDVTSDFVRDLERLSRASKQLSQAREWVDEHMNAGSPLAELTRGAAQAKIRDGQVLAEEAARTPESRDATQSLDAEPPIGRPGASESGISDAGALPAGEIVEESSQQERYGVQSSGEGRRSGLDPQQVGPTARRRQPVEDVKLEAKLREPENDKAKSAAMPPFGVELPPVVTASSKVRMDDPFNIHQPSSDRSGGLVSGPTRDEEESARLQQELERAREELRRLREKATHQTQVYGAIGDQSRRLDRRTLDLKDRVAQAQQALDERARGYRSDLQKDRQRLRDYRDKLQRKAKELAESTRAQNIRLAERRAQLALRAEEIDARRLENEHIRQELSDRQVDLARRSEELESLRHQVEQARRESREKQSELSRLAEELESLRTRSDDQNRSASERLTELDRREGQLAELRAETDAAKRANLEKETELARAQEALVTLRAETEAVRRSNLDNANELARREEALESLHTETETVRRANSEKEAEIAGREKELRALKAEYEENTRGTLERLKAESEQALENRIRELEEQAGERMAALEEAEQTVREKEAELEQMRREEDQVQRDREEEFQSRKSALEEQIGSGRQELAAEIGAQRAEIISEAQNAKAHLEEELAHRGEELESQLELIAKRESTIKIQEEALDGRLEALEVQAAELKERDRGLQRNIGEHANAVKEVEERERHLREWQASIEKIQARLESDQRELGKTRDEIRTQEREAREAAEELDVREGRLQEWQSRVERNEARLEAERQELEEQRAEANRTSEKNSRLGSDLEAQSEALSEAQAKLDEAQEEIQEKRGSFNDRLADLDRRETFLQARVAEADKQQRELGNRIGEFKAAAEKPNDIQPLTDEVERREADLLTELAAVSRREAAIEKRETLLQSEREAMESARTDLAETRIVLEQREAEFAAREKGLPDRIVQAAELEQHVRRVEAEREAQAAGLRARIEAHEKRFRSLDEDRDAVDRDRRELEEAKVALDLDRRKLAEEIQSAKDERAAIEEDRSQSGAERQKSAESSTGAAEKEAELNQQRQLLVEEKNEFEGRVAKLERDRIESQDRERSLCDERSHLDKERSELERIRAKLESRVREAKDLRNRLVGKVERHKHRKAHLAEDLAEMEAKRRGLGEQLKELEDERALLREERREFEAERAALPAEQEALQGDREELEQARRTYEAGLRELDEGRRNLAEREAKLGDRADQLEAYRDRLEEEYADLQAQRQELVAIQEEHGNSAEQFAALMQQTESREEQLRQREESLLAHEEALSARAGELAGNEAEVERVREKMEARLKESEAQCEALDLERREIEALRSSAIEAVEAQRREIEAELSEKREAIRQRRCELEEEARRQVEQLEEEHLDREGINLDQMHRKVEAELSERIAEVKRREAEAGARCESRLEEVQRDIDNRLEIFEADIKERRTGAERDYADRRERLEVEMVQMRARLESEIEDLRRGQAALAQERALLRQREADLASNERGGPIELETGEPHADGGDRMLPEDDIVEIEAEAPSAPEVSPHAEPSDEIALEPVLGGVEPEADDPASTEITELTPEPIGVPRRRFGMVLTTMCALVLGGLLAGAVMWSPNQDVRIRGRWMLAKGDSQAKMSASEHVKAIKLPEVLAAASREVGVDLQKEFDARNLEIVPSESTDAVEVSVSAAPEDRRNVQEWLGAMGRSYEARLAVSVVSESRRKGLLAAAEKRYADAQAREVAASGDLDRLQSALSEDPVAQELIDARQQQAAMKEKAARALSTLEAARAAVKALEAAPAPTGPAVPSEDELARAASDDRDLLATVAEQEAKAKEFHQVLTEAMSQSQTPLMTLLSSIDAFSNEVRRQLEKQTDSEIKGELESVQLDLTDYREFADRFSKDWDSLNPKVAAWKPGDAPDLLLEYQQKAEVLVREFHSSSKVALGNAIKKADATGRGGAEMTKRRIVQSALARHAHPAFGAWKDWVDAAIGVVPANNVSLKALQTTLRNIAPRIDERRQAHRVKLSVQLAEEHEADRKVELSRLEEKLRLAEARHRELTDEAMTAMERVDSLNQTALKTAQDRRDRIAEQQGRVAVLEKTLSREAAQIEKLRTGTGMSLAGAAGYRPLAPIVPSQFDWEKRNQAAAVGGGFAALFVLTFWWMARPRRAERQQNS